MKVLLYAPLAVLGHHFETDLELAQKHMDAGDEVSIVRCSGQLRKLDFYACHGGLRCALCKSRGDQGVAQLRGTNLRVMTLDALVPVESTAGHDLSSIESIKQIKFSGADIGSAYMSSFISDLRNPRPPMQGLERKSKKIIDGLAGLTNQLEKILDFQKPDLVYFFNGRFSIYRPLLRLCQKRGIDFFVHERGANNNLYSLYKNNLPHEISLVTQNILEKWTDGKVSLDEKRRIASEWYEKRAAGQSLAWRSFTDRQDLTLFPEGWNSKQTNVVFFVSSEDEVTSVPGWEFTITQSQAHAIGHICRHYMGDPNFAFYVRMHPNVRGLKNASIDELLGLENKFSNCTVIVPESPVSTYLLMRAADKVISFGSTVGVEASYWGRPSISIGKSFYGALDACYNPQSLDEAIQLVADVQLKPMDKTGALQYGYWAATVGYPFRYYKPINLTTGSFRGVVLTGSKYILFLNYFFVLLIDLKKIVRGEYSWWHLSGRIRHKVNGLLKKAPSL